MVYGNSEKSSLDLSLLGEDYRSDGTFRAVEHSVGFAFSWKREFCTKQAATWAQCEGSVNPENVAQAFLR